MKLYGRQPRVLIVKDSKPCRRERVGERKMVKARHRYKRRADRLELKGESGAE